LGIERILSARKFQGVVEDSRAKDFYLSYKVGFESLAIKKAAELRAAGKIVEVSLTPQSKSEVEKSCAEKNCSEWIYVE
jgi:ATP phosphoribosyltransferase regulatory subunit